jgi:hypothetical protein
MTQVDILLMGHEDAQALFNIENQTEPLSEPTLQRGLDLGASIVVLKLGEQVLAPWQPVTAPAQIISPGSPCRSGR